MTALDPLVKSANVIAAAIFDDYGDCRQSHLPAPYDPLIVHDLIEKLGDAFDAFAALGNTSPLRCFAADCEAGSVLMRRVEDFTVVALVEQAANLSLINVALNVVGLKLRREAETSKSASDRFLSPSASSSLGQSGSFVQDVDMVARSALRRLLKLYQQEVGPAAKLILKQELARLGLSARALRLERYPELVRGLGLRIPDERARTQFVSQALRLIPQQSVEH